MVTNPGVSRALWAHVYASNFAFRLDERKLHRTLQAFKKWSYINTVFNDLKILNSMVKKVKILQWKLF